MDDIERLTRERDKERKHVARLMRDLEHNRKRAESAEARLASPQPANPAQVTDAMVEHMVQRFLGWRLPETFGPDAGIRFERVANAGTPYEYKHEPVGTNLFDYTEAKAMVQHMVEGLPAAIGAGGQAVAYEPCGGCGEKNPDKRCIGCLHPFSALSQPQPADERVVEALREARQLVDIATDWNLDEVEINGEMVKTHSLGSKFDTVIEALTAKEGR